MTDMFVWDTYVGSSGQGQFRTRSAQFGDGYSQDVGDGLNVEVQTWTVSFPEIDSDTLDDIMRFLRAHQGWQSFLWAPPNGELGYYVCKEYTMNPEEAEVRNATATFEQVFRP